MSWLWHRYEQDPIAPEVVEEPPEPPKMSAGVSMRALTPPPTGPKPSRFSTFFYQFDSPETEKKFEEFQGKDYGQNIRRVFLVLAAFCVFRLVEAIVHTNGQLNGFQLWVRVGLVVFVLSETIIMLLVVRVTWGTRSTSR